MKHRRYFHALSAAASLWPTFASGQAQQGVESADASQDIVVTAQRREERITEVPIAIVAASAERLQNAGVTSLRDLTVVTPGLRVSGTGINVSPAIRGVNSDSNDPGNDANVSIYIDNVYQSSQLANNFDLADVARIEILKGPQGTLFGRNATGGAIRIFTRDPSLDSAQGALDASYGSYDEIVAKGFVSVPLKSGQIAASASGYYSRNDGFNFDVGRGRHSMGAESKVFRLKLLAKPVDNLTIVLSGAYSRQVDGDAVAYTPLNGNSEARGNAKASGAIIPDTPFEYASNLDARFAATKKMASARIEYTTGIGSISSTTGYNDVVASYTNDGDGSTALLTDYPIYETQKDVSQELIFSSNRFGVAQITAGMFYYNGKGRYDPLIVRGASIGAAFGVEPLYGYMLQKTDAVSGFGEVNLELAEHITLIGGLRYSHETRESLGAYYLTAGRPISLPRVGKASFSSWTPRASVRYAFPSGDNAYFTYSRGFKSGGFSLAELNPSPFKPETLDAFEVGLKTATSRRISANISAFYYNYANKQVLSNVNGTSVTSNAASARIYGADADVTARIGDELTVTAGLAYLNSKWRKFVSAPVNEQILIGGLPCFCGNTTVTRDLSGGRQPYSPEFTGTFSATYTHDTDLGRFMLTSTVYYTSEFSFDNNFRVRQAPYATISARASLRLNSWPLEIYVWGRNLTDHTYTRAALISNAGDGAAYGKPRTLGIGARYEF